MFKSTWDIIWWWVVTAWTIWYWDKYPQSFVWQLAAIVFMIISLGIFAQIMSKIVESLNSKNFKKMNWTLKSKISNHIIIYCENDIWFSKTIEDILTWNEDEKVVIITPDTEIPKDIQSLDTKYPSRIDWISWKPDDKQVLGLANINNARSIMLFKEARNPHSDTFLLSYILTIRELNSDIYIIADVVDSDNKNKFYKAGCNSIINTEEISEKLIYRSFTDWVHRIISDLLTSDDWFEIYKIDLDSKWIWKTFKHLIKENIENDINIIAISNLKKEFFYDRSYKIKDWDFAFVISKNRINSL